MAIISENRYLSYAEALENSKAIFSQFKAYEWSDIAICAMLGNMWRESTVNPGIWQNLTVDTSMGYGLVQWTPSTNYTWWAVEMGYEIDNIYAQCNRIEYEFNNGLQYYPTDEYPLTADEFRYYNGNDLDYMTAAFLANYERAGVSALEERIEYAHKFYNDLKGTTPDNPNIPTTKKKKSKYNFILFSHRRRKQWTKGTMY